MRLNQLVASALSAVAVLVAAPKAEGLMFDFYCGETVHHYLVEISGGGTHIVKQGDTLWDVAKQRYGVGRAYVMLAQSNHLSNPDNLHSGQLVSLPLVSKKTLTGTTHVSSCPAGVIGIADIVRAEVETVYLPSPVLK